MSTSIMTLRLPPAADADSIEWSKLPDVARASARRWLEEFHAIAQGEGLLGARIAACAARMNVSVQTARRRWDATKKHGWRGLLDYRVAKINDVGLPEATIEYWKGLCENEGRSSRQAWRKMILVWREAYTEQKGFPGFALAPAPAVGGVPRGFSYANLMQHAPTKYELKASRIGRAAAADLRPLVLTSRVGLSCGQFYQFDDVWHDIMVNFLGVNRRALRPLELCALDVYSTKRVIYGLKPMLDKDASDQESGRAGLLEKDMRLLVAALLSQQGYRPEGCTLVVEHGTAAISEAFERQLYDLSDGAIRVCRSGIQDRPAVLGTWAGQKRGNFRLKAMMESLHGLSHNALAALPGATGSNSRLNKPEALDATVRYNDRLLKELAEVPAERMAAVVAALQFPLLHWGQYASIVDDVYTWVDSRTLHDLEGWERAGLITSEFRLSIDSAWHPQALLPTLPASEQDAVLAVATKPGMARIRRLSPNEVWSQARGLRKFREQDLAPLLSPDLGEECKVGDNGEIVFKNRELDSEALRYRGVALDPQGQTITLRDGETYRMVVNPFALDKLLVLDAAGRYIGACPRVVRVCKADTEAVYKQIGAVAHEERQRLAGLRARHTADADDRAAMIANNAQVLRAAGNGGAITLDERAKVREAIRRIRADKTDVADILDAEAAPAELVSVPAGAGRAYRDDADLSDLL